MVDVIDIKNLDLSSKEGRQKAMEYIREKLNSAGTKENERILKSLGNLLGLIGGEESLELASVDKMGRELSDMAARLIEMSEVPLALAKLEEKPHNVFLLGEIRGNLGVTAGMLKVIMQDLVTYITKASPKPSEPKGSETPTEVPPPPDGAN